MAPKDQARKGRKNRLFFKAYNNSGGGGYNSKDEVQQEEEEDERDTNIANKEDKEDNEEEDEDQGEFSDLDNQRPKGPTIKANTATATPAAQQRITTSHLIVP